MRDVIGELRPYVLGWLGDYKLSATCTAVQELAGWVRRRVRLYYRKQWKAPERSGDRHAAYPFSAPRGHDEIARGKR